LRDWAEMKDESNRARPVLRLAYHLLTQSFQEARNLHS